TGSTLDARKGSTGRFPRHGRGPTLAALDGPTRARLDARRAQARRDRSREGLTRARLDASGARRGQGAKARRERRSTPHRRHGRGSTARRAKALSADRPPLDTRKALSPDRPALDAGKVRRLDAGALDGLDADAWALDGST